MGRPNDLRTDDFYNLIAKKVGQNATPNLAKKYLKALYEVILDELKLNGRISIFRFGIFEIKQVGGYDKKINLDGVIRYVQPKEKITFRPSDTFNKAVNECDYTLPKIKSRRIYKNTKEKERAHYERHKPPKKPMEDSVINLLNKVVNQ